MTIGWNDNSPIYRQLKDRMIGMMLDGALKARSHIGGTAPARVKAAIAKGRKSLA